MAAHPAAVTVDGATQLLRRGGPRSADRAQDPSAGRVQLLVRGTRRAQGELADPVSREAQMRVAVDETRHGTQPAAVQLDDVARERSELAHAPDGFDPLAGAEDERILEESDGTERTPAKRRLAARGRDDLGQVADEQPRAFGAHA